MKRRRASFHDIWRRLPAYGVNGMAVALGIGVVHLVFGLWGGFVAAQLAGSAAVCASLADLPNTADRTWQRVLASALLAVIATTVVATLRLHPVALGLAIVVTVFAAMMTMAWGLRAGPVSFAPVLALVFAMAMPDDVAGGALIGWGIAGALTYLSWSALTSVLLQRQYRRLALQAAVRAAANLLRSRAAMLSTGGAHRDQTVVSHWLAGEAMLAERLQAARDLLFAAPAAPDAPRGTAILLQTIDLRDVLLASRLDLDLLGGGTFATQVLESLAERLHGLAAALDEMADAVGDGNALVGPLPCDTRTDHLFARVPLPEDDGRRRALELITRRLQHIGENVAAIHRLVQGGAPELPLSRDQLQRFVGSETWPLQMLRNHLSVSSPVLRHAVRMSLALATAYYLAWLLPWASHPHWLVLSVAVVLRGNLEQTLTRRNARVLGTFFGCLLVVAFVRTESPVLVEAVFLVSVGIAHSFVNVRYWVTATAATVMALLQSHLADPVAGFAIGERLADTVLGALLGWGFSYVLPSWERHSLPQTVGRTLAALNDYARRVLAPGAPDAVEQRLARHTAYDALAAVAAAAQRSLVEPKRTRLPLDEMTTFLDHAQRLMAHLSSVRLMLARESAALRNDAAAAALRAAAIALGQALDARNAPAMSGEREARQGVAAAVAGASTAAPVAVLGPDPVHDFALRAATASAPDHRQQPPSAAAAAGVAAALGTRAPSARAAAAGDAARPGVMNAADLPEDPPATDPVPWLLRRLQLSVEDARRIQVSATAALASLH